MEEWRIVYSGEDGRHVSAANAINNATQIECRPNPESGPGAHAFNQLNLRSSYYDWGALTSIGDPRVLIAMHLAQHSVPGVGPEPWTDKITGGGAAPSAGVASLEENLENRRALEKLLGLLPAPVAKTIVQQAIECLARDGAASAGTRMTVIRYKAQQVLAELVDQTPDVSRCSSYADAFGAPAGQVSFGVRKGEIVDVSASALKGARVCLEDGRELVLD